MCFKNRNILAAFLFVSSNGITYSIWGSPMLPLFIQMFTGDNIKSTSYVGIAEGVQGATQCLFALVSGILADKLSRHIVLKAAGIAQLIAASVTLLAVYLVKLFPNVPQSADNSSGFSATWLRNDNSANALYQVPLNYVGLRASPIPGLGPANGVNHSCGPATNISLVTTAAPVAPFDPHGNWQWYILCIACGFWGVYSGLYGPSMEALFADSIETGERAKYYIKRKVAQTTARATGPVLALVAFYALNDQWTLPILTWVLTGGLVLTVFPSLVLLCLFHDKYTLGLKNEAITATRKQIQQRKLQKAATAATTVATFQNQNGSQGASSSDADISPEDSANTEDHNDDGLENNAAANAQVENRDVHRPQPRDAARSTGPKELVDPLADNGTTDGEGASGKREIELDNGEHSDSDSDSVDSEEIESCCCRCCAGVRAIPWIILASNTVTGFATGMTVKFFPIFFKEAVCLTPAEVNIIYAVTPFIQALATYGSRYLAKSWGRVMTVQIQRFLGTLCLFIMAWRTELWAQPWIIVPLYVTRTVLTSCGWPLINSVLNDYTAKKHRAKFNSMQSIAGFGWSFSALLGGYIISGFTHDEDAGFSLVFYITCAMQLVTIGLRFFVIPLMPRREISTDESQGRVAGDRKKLRRKTAASADLTDDRSLGVDDHVVVQTPTSEMGGNREEHRRRTGTDSSTDSHTRSRKHSREASAGVSGSGSNNLSEPLLENSSGEGQSHSHSHSHRRRHHSHEDPAYGYGGGRRENSNGSASKTMIYTYREDSGGANV